METLGSGEGEEKYAKWSVVETSVGESNYCRLVR